MLYAGKIIDLMAAYPGRRWQVQQIRRYIAGATDDRKALRSMQKAIQRALIALSEAGAIVIHESDVNGRPFEYEWKRDMSQGKTVDSRDSSCDIGRGQVPLEKACA